MLGKKAPQNTCMMPLPLRCYDHLFIAILLCCNNFNSLKDTFRLQVTMSKGNFLFYLPYLLFVSRVFVRCYFFPVVYSLVRFFFSAPLDNQKRLSLNGIVYRIIRSCKSTHTDRKYRKKFSHSVSAEYDMVLSC